MSAHNFFELPRNDAEIRHYMIERGVRWMDKEEFQSMDTAMAKNFVEYIVATKGMCHYVYGNHEINRNNIREQLNDIYLRREDMDVAFVVDAKTGTPYTFMIVNHKRCTRTGEPLYVLEIICSARKENMSFSKLLMFTYVSSLYRRGARYGVLEVALGVNVSAQRLYEHFGFCSAEYMDYPCFDEDSNPMVLDLSKFQGIRVFRDAFLLKTPVPKTCTREYRPNVKRESRVANMFRHTRKQPAARDAWDQDMPDLSREGPRRLLYDVQGTTGRRQPQPRTTRRSRAFAEYARDYSWGRG